METYHHPRRPNLEDFEYTVCDNHNPPYNNNSHSLPIVLVMKYQEGFEWNEDVFFNTYRQAQCKRHKSKFRKEREELIKQACNASNISTTDGKNNNNNRYLDRVMEIELSAKDKDVLP